MADSLRDQLLKSGLVQKLKSEAKPETRPPSGKPTVRNDRSAMRSGAARPSGGGTPASAAKPQKAAGEPDLAQAYALRARSEREERERAQREAEQKAREKRERKEKIARLLDGKALNVADAEHARHFEHGGKIRRVYCSGEQLAALNRGELAVVQQNGRYLLVGAEVGAQVKAIASEALVLLVDPNAALEDDIPADLIW